MSDETSAPAVGEVAAPPAPPQFVRADQRFRVVPLEWPLTYDGVTYDSVTVRRMTGQALADFVRSAGDDGVSVVLPMFDVPQAVIDALDPDDADNVDQAVQDFLPRSLRTVVAPTPDSGAATQA